MLQKVFLYPSFYSFFIILSKNYIHYNSVKHGLVNNVNDRQYSYFHRFVKLGLYKNDRGSEKDIKSIKNLVFE